MTKRTGRVKHIGRTDGRLYISLREKYTLFVDKESAKKMFPFVKVGDYVEMTVDEHGRIMSSGVMTYREPTIPQLECQECISL